MRPTTLLRGAILCGVALIGAATFALVAAPKAQAYTVTDLSVLGYSVLSDNKGNGCIAWSAGLPGYNRTLIGQDCWATFQALLDNYINQTLPALQAWQTQHAASLAAVSTVTTTVMRTVYDSAGGTFTITVTNPGLTVTTPPATVTAPPVTVTAPSDPAVFVMTVTGPTITLPPLIIERPPATVTIDHPAPPPQTITETATTTMTETQTVASTRTVTVKVPVTKPKTRRRAAFRTG